MQLNFCLVACVKTCF
uniref:Uncharacterized protein n=1 Tax=Rhizophora mucronata TaxID=61149 RepID=A0A2P2PZV4_RHIMU